MSNRPTPQDPDHPLERTTVLIDRVLAGDAAARDELFRRLQPELKRLAQSIVQRRSHGVPGPSATTLFQSASRRLLERDALDAGSRREMFGLFCRAMEDEWVEQARHDLAQKRQPPGRREPLIDFAKDMTDAPFDFEKLRLAIRELGGIDPDVAEIVMLRYYADASLREVAEITGTTLGVVRGKWSYAKAWLIDRMTAEGPNG